MKKLLVILALLPALAVAANSPKKQPQPSSILYDVTAQKVIHDINANHLVSIASMTKIMTVLAVLKAEQNMDEMLVVQGREGSRRIRAGMRMTRRDLIELTLVSSDNLAARTLIETYPNGGVSGIMAMNVIAEELGADDTTFIEPTGLMAGNRSTMADMIKITAEAAKYPIFREMANKTTASVQAEQVGRARRIMRGLITGNNTNPFAHESSDFQILVAKTGLTSAAGWCLTMMIIYDQRTYILVTAGNRDRQSRKRMADYLIALSTNNRYQLAIKNDDPGQGGL